MELMTFYIFSDVKSHNVYIQCASVLALARRTRDVLCAVAWLVAKVMFSYGVDNAIKSLSHVNKICESNEKESN